MTDIDYDALEMLPAEEEQAGDGVDLACASTCLWTCSWTSVSDL